MWVAMVRLRSCSFVLKIIVVKGVLSSVIVMILTVILWCIWSNIYVVELSMSQMIADCWFLVGFVLGLEMTLLIKVSSRLGILCGICVLDRFRVVFETILGTKFVISCRHLLWSWLSLVICLMLVFCVCVVSAMRYISFPCLRAEKVVPRYLIGVLGIVDVGR